ncbi:gustatory receptor 54 [Tribolium castaneum]|uniref:Gustatory receptor n=1 Tax=Tribolium castaneum TaxID=7070 RepID=A2AX94_TRICA|nr:gustatory receptor 54 [Tribolium castaneum]CAL23165.2 gustatory receptor candidate 32 [Tribolium castaneum]|eukprot:NP_001161925.1 gustatory receptor 54 [Tribolium castaneum]
MSFKLLRLVLKVGHFFAITPGFRKNRTTCPEKIYAYGVVAFITLGVAVSVFYRAKDYAKFIHIKAVVQITLDATLYVQNIYTVLTALTKKPLWFKLLKNLKMVQNHNNIREKSHYCLFVASNCFFWSYQSYMSYIFANIMGLEFYKQFAIEYFQMYVLFFVNFAFFVVVKMLLVRYRNLTKQLRFKLRFFEKLGNRRLGFVQRLDQIQFDICLLKEGVDLVNDIFGWQILFLITYATLQILVYLHLAVMLGFQDIYMIVYIIVVIFWYTVNASTNIFLCDEICNEGQTILGISYSLEKLKTGDEIQDLISTIKDNFPRFYAARFFVINRGTILGILDAIVTFLIVMIQFEMTQNSTNINFVSTFFKIPFYSTLRPINLLVQIILDVILLILNVHTILTTITKRNQWCKLLENLKLDRENNSSFVVANVLFQLIHVYYTVVFTLLLGVDFVKEYAFEYIQLYSQFILYFLLFATLKILLGKYTQLKACLMEEKRPMVSLQVIKAQIYSLRETVDVFNDIFGWPFLLLITFTSLQIMVYLQHIFVKSRPSPATIISNVTVISWQAVCTFYNILLCDSVAHTAGELLGAVYSLDLELKHIENFNDFVTALKDNVPVFAAARFYAINRSTIFRMFNAIVTFLIVMVQFETNYSQP